MAFCSPTRLSPRILRWYQAGSDELKVEVLGPHRFSAVLYWSGKIQTSPRHVMWYFFPRLPAILGSGKDSFLHHSLRDATNNGNDLSFLSTLFFFVLEIQVRPGARLSLQLWVSMALAVIYLAVRPGHVGNIVFFEM
jgi:hypothetical protein